MSVDTKLQQFILNVLNEEQYNSITNKDANQLYFTDYIEYYTKEETNNILPLFRGSFDDWSSVPVSASNYAFDFLGSSTPTQNDFILVKNYETRSYDILDYVESTGSQYINLGIVPTVGKTYELTFEPTSNLTGTLFGTNKTDIYSTPTTNGHSIAVNIGNTEGLNEIGNLVSEVYTITINATSINSNLGNITLKNPYSGDLPDTEMYLGALNNNGTASNFAPCKYKGFKVLQDGILENEYVPAIRTSDNTIGFLDKVSNVFYDNLGDNPFVAGEVISSIGSEASESGSWICIYNGDWATNGKGGWTPAFALVSSGGGSMPTRYVEAINGKTGNVTLTASEVGAYTTTEVDDLLDSESQSIRTDLNKSISDVQTIVEQQATTIANKQDKLTAIQLTAVDSGITSDIVAQVGINTSDILDNAGDIAILQSDKQDIITDLNTIRSGATLGNTSIQPGDNITELTNNAGYITSIPDEYITETKLNNELSGYAKKSEIPEGSIVDDAFSTTSTNAVQNKVITNKLNEIETSIPTSTSDLTNDSGYISDENLNNIRTDITSLQNSKQDKLTAGTGISIEDNVISSTIIPSDLSWGNIGGDINSQLDLQEVLNNKADKNEIPTVNDKTLTIQKNGVDIATFTANSNSDITANISVPTNVSELNNDSKYITKDVNDLTNYTKTTDLPTNLSEFTNDTNFQDATQVNSAIDTHNNSQTAHTDIRNLISDLQSQIDDNTGDIAKLDADKQDVITDLSDIRNNAETGANLTTQVNTNKDNISLLQTNKADKSTTLSGYNISDAYTKIEIDTKVSSIYLTKNDAQSTYETITNVSQLSTKVDSKQDKLTAGENIAIENNVISATGSVSINYDSNTETLTII